MFSSRSEREEQLRLALEEARAKLLEQDEMLKQLTEPPLFLATVVTTTGDSAVVVHEGKVLELGLPTHKSISAGDLVKLSSKTMQIIDLAGASLPGEIGVVRRVVEGMPLVDYQGTERMVYAGRYTELQKGDRVVLDGTGSVVMRNLGREDERFRFNLETRVTWNDIGGLAAAKELMVEAIELPFLHPDVYAFYNKKPVKGVLLYGPPGCGKTMLGKASATALARLHGAGKSTGFFYIKGPEILDKFVGVTEAVIRQIFALARKHFETHGYPAVIFIDEADAILGIRGSGISSDIERTIVPMFLTEMDGLEESGALVILATNRTDVLDPAVVRDKRIDRKVKVGRPTLDTAPDVFRLYLSEVPLAAGFNVESLCQFASDRLYCQQYSLYDIALKGGDSAQLYLGHITNGGMIAGIVDQATSLAMKRDLAAGSTPGHSRGLREKDIADAVELVFEQNRDLNHSDELQEFVQDNRLEVAGVRRQRQGHN